MIFSGLPTLQKPLEDQRQGQPGYARYSIFRIHPSVSRCRLQCLYLCEHVSLLPHLSSGQPWANFIIYYSIGDNPFPRKLQNCKVQLLDLPSIFTIVPLLGVADRFNRRDRRVLSNKLVFLSDHQRGNRKPIAFHIGR